MEARKRLQQVSIPGVGALSLVLPAEIKRLRNVARARQQGAPAGCPEIVLSDAQAWADRPEGEEWLIWRARMTAERLRSLPVELEPGERVVGRPRLREPADDAERACLEEARRILQDVPPYPGGDAGHFHPDYETAFALGLGGLRRRIVGLAGASGPSTEAFYEACRIALDGMIAYVERVAEACDREARGTEAPAHWRAMGRMCRRLAAAPPETFHEALQLMFLIQIALWFGSGQGLTSPGRMDQTLWRFYCSDIAAGRLTPRGALELIVCLYIQMNRILWPGSAVAVMVGGRNAQGRDRTNELTYLCLAARMATGLVYPTVGLAWHREAPSELMDFAVSMVGTGVGDPAFFNDELIVSGLMDHDVAVEDACDYVNSTCVEIKVAGKSNIWVTAPYFNLAGWLLDVIQQAAREPEGVCPRCFRDLVRRFKRRAAAEVAAAARRLDDIWCARAERGCFPLASCFVRDCLERGRDFDRGGARYNWVENSFVGLANVVDGLIAIRHLVYVRGELTLRQMWQMLRDDFSGAEGIRRRIASLPRYGNDEEEPDALALELAEFLIATTESNTVGAHRYVPGFFCWIQHERLGEQTGATPDGRRAGWPLADGAGAAQGRESRGPTAAVLSTTKWCHRAVLGGLVHNTRFDAKMFSRASDRRAVRSVIETYLSRGGFEMQINVVSTDQLRRAQVHPEQHRDLLVRVAGYSDYFVHLNRNMQEEIIARTEFETG